MFITSKPKKHFFLKKALTTFPQCLQVVKRCINVIDGICLTLSV